MFIIYKKLILFSLVTAIICAFSNFTHAKTLKSCGAADPNELTVYEFYGEAELDNFGIGLDSAGDFDGDGIVDLIVGAPYSDANAANGGAAYLFLGGVSGDPNWDYRLLGEAADDAFGIAVAGVGDLDGDGFDDIAIGASNNDRAGADSGAAWIIYGSAPPFGERQMVLTNPNSKLMRFGYSIAAGDFNGDGYNDLAISAPQRRTTEIEKEKVYLYFGGSTMDGVPDLTIEAPDYDQGFGLSLACAGDANDDGFDDLIIGSPYYGLSWLEPQYGRAYINFGGNPMDTTPDIVLTGESTYCQLGHSVAGAGDINGDGFDDVLIGSPLYPGGQTGNPAWGKAYLLHGGFSMDNTPDIEFVGEATDDQLGWSVDGGLDLNRDGFDDIIIGARFHDCPAQDGGAAYVYYGGNPMDVYPDISASSSEDDDVIGSSVAMIGEWSASMPLAAAAAIWNDKGMDVNDPMHEGAFGAVFAFTSPACILGDFNRDTLVDWTDLGVFVQRWLDNNCDDLNWCGETDLDKDTKVDFEDFALIADGWLQGCN